MVYQQNNNYKFDEKAVRKILYLKYNNNLINILNYFVHFMSKIDLISLFYILLCGCS